MTKIDGGFCPKLDPRTIRYTRLDEERSGKCNGFLNLLTLHYENNNMNLILQTCFIMGSSPSELSEELVMQEKQKKGWRMNCDVGEAAEGLENEL